MDLQLPLQSVHITTKVVSSHPVHGEVYSIQHYVIKFVSDLRQVSGFTPDTPVSSMNKTDCHDVTEMLLKVALNTKKTNKFFHMFWSRSVTSVSPRSNTIVQEKQFSCKMFILYGFLFFIKDNKDKSLALNKVQCEQE